MHADTGTPFDTIAAILGNCQPQVTRIVATMLADSALPREIAVLRETTDALQERLDALTADEADCIVMLGRLDSPQFDRLPEFDGLDADAAQDMRRSLQRRLKAHRTVLQNHQGALTRGIEIGRTGLVNRFATFAVAGLGKDSAASMPSGLAFIVACQIAAQLKDRLETAGYRWAGEKTLVSLYLHAIGCERRQSPERLVADPAASVIATRLGFRSARELHRALHALDQAQAPAAPALPGDDPAAQAQRIGRLGHVAFDRAACPNFDASYHASSALDDAFLHIMARARSGPATA